MKEIPTTHKPCTNHAPEIEKLALSIAEAAESLSVSRPTMYQIIKREDFTAAFKIGSCTRISKAGLMEWIDRQTGGEKLSL